MHVAQFLAPSLFHTSPGIRNLARTEPSALVATCRIAEFWIAVRVSLYHFAPLKKITGVACRIGKSLQKKGQAV
jgi:hypothetical protein